MNRPSKLTGIDAFKISNIIIYWKDIIFIMESDIKGQDNLFSFSWKASVWSLHNMNKVICKVHNCYTWSWKNKLIQITFGISFMKHVFNSLVIFIYAFRLIEYNTNLCQTMDMMRIMLIHWYMYYQNNNSK